MSKKIGVILALDGEKEFTQGLKNAQASAKLLKSGLTGLASEYKGNANSLEYLTQRQEKLKEAQTAYGRVLSQAKTGQANALQSLNKQKDALEDLRKQLDKAKKAQKEMEDAGDKSSQTYKDQCKAVEELEESVRAQNTEYLKAEGRLTSWDQKVSEAERSVRENSKALQKNETYMKEAGTAADHCATSIDKFGKEAEDATDSVEELGVGLGTMIKAKAVDLAGDALQELGQKAAEAAKKVIEVGSDFEKAMSEVEAISGAAGSELDQISEKAQALGSSTKFSATEVAEGFKYMSLAGWDTSEMLNAIDGVVNLAAASEMELGEASDMVTDYLSAFGLAASDAGKMADQMAYAQANSNTSVSQLGEAYGNCAANMHAAGQDMETTTSFLEAMANQGRKGAQAGTTLSAVMRDMTSKMKDGKIQIGDTSVAVQDSEGNFRDLTDIMLDVEEATEGMGSAEKTTALSATFTAKSIAGVNMILNEGVTEIAGYEKELRNADGAASDMAGTMENNLQGAITELDSAAEGLGIALYDKVKGPLTDAVETATGLLSGITEAITPQKTELETFLDEIEESNEDVKNLLESAREHTETAESQVADLEAYKSVLLELNSVEEKDEFQKYQMKNAVEALSSTIPGLKENFDEETASLSLTNDELSDMFENAEALAMQNALIAAQEDAYNALAQATINKAKADAAVSAATKAMNEAEEKNAQTQDALNGGVGDYISEVVASYQAVDDAEKVQEEANEQLEAAQEAIVSTDEALKPLYDKYGILTDSTEEAADAQNDLTDSMEDTEDAEDDAAEAAEEAAQKIIDAHTNAAEAITEAYQTAKEQIEGTFDIDPLGDGFDGGVDKTVESMNESLQTQIEGMQNYTKNMELVKEHLGKEIAPEFMEYLIGLGEDGANALEHIAITFEEDNGAEKVKELSDQYVESLNMREGIAESLAQDSVALQAGLGQLGSAAEEWDGLDQVVASVTSQEGAVSDATLQAFRQAEQTARECGVAIPEGLADGIENSDDPESALQNAAEQLNAAISGQAEGLMETARQSGLDIPQWISDGITAGGDSAVEAYQALLELLSQDSGSVEEAASEAGTTLTEGTAEAISDGSGSVESAAADMASGAAEAADEKASAYTEAGSNAAAEFADGLTSQQGKVTSSGTTLAQGIISALSKSNAQSLASGSQSGSNFASGILSASGSASSAGASLASAAINGIRNNSSGSSSIGYSISSGVASGISNGASSAVNAAISMARNALSAAKKELGIASPSKKFRDQVGKQIGAGVAFGIKQSVSSTSAQAEKLAAATLTAASSWLRNYKKKQKVTVKDEIYFWEKMLKSMQSGTSAYSTAVEKWADANIKNAFGVSKTKTTGTGKNQKTTQKDTETYYSEVYSAAQKFFQKMELKESQSVKQEISYWTKVQKTLKKGTSAYTSAAEKINELKSGIGTTEAASTLLENVSTYFDLSEKAEMQYWDKVRRQYKKGTEERIKADQKYYEAKKAYTEKLESIEDEYAEKIREVKSTLKESIADLKQTYQDAVNDRKEQIADAFDLFDAFESESATGEDLLFNIKSQAAGYKDWREQLDELEARGVLSDDLLEELTEKGPTDSAAIHALNSLSDEQLKEYDEAYQTKMSESLKQAKEDTADLEDETAEQIAELKDTAAKEIEDLKAQRAQEMAEVNTSISDGLSTLAENIRSIASDQTAALTGILQKAEGSENGQKASKTNARLVNAINNGSDSSVEQAEDPIKAILESGKKRSTKITKKEKEAHPALWEYIVSHYGRTPTASMYKSLAEELGVKVSKTITRSQKTAILKALKKKGYRQGTKKLDEDYAWMDEEGLGSELIIRKSDGAILNTAVQKGDAILPADLTDHLYQWGEYTPEQILSVISAQQQAMQELVSRTANAVSLADLNEKALGAEEITVKTGTGSELKETLSGIADLIRQFLPYLAEKQEIVLDSGKLVSGIADDMSNELAMRQRRKR